MADVGALKTWSAGEAVTATDLNSNFAILKDWLNDGNIAASHMAAKYTTHTFVLQREDALQSGVTPTVDFVVKIDADIVPKLATLQVTTRHSLSVAKLSILDDATQLITGDTLTAATTDLVSTGSFTASNISAGTELTFRVFETAGQASSNITVTLTGLVEVRST